MSSTLKRNPLREVPRVYGSRERIWGVLADNAGQAVDLTGKTILCRVIAQGASEAAIDDQAATVFDAAAGQVYYSPTVADALALAVGRYAVYFLIDEAPQKRHPYDGPRYILDVIDEAEAEAA